MNVKVLPSTYLGETQAVPSKSNAHRLLVAAALKKGKTLIKNVGYSDDVKATARCLSLLGADVVFVGGDALVTGMEEVRKGQVLPAGESGSTLRFLLPVAAALGADCTFTGEGRLFSRPNAPLCEALKKGGAECDGRKVAGRLTGGRYEIDASVSSQYVSGLLFALPLLERDSELVLLGESVSKKYVDMTLDVLQKSGVRVEKTKEGFFIPGGQEYRLPDEMTCEGDWSSAAFMLVAGAVGGRVRVDGLNVDSLQGDKVVLDVLNAFGADVLCGDGFVEVRKNEARPFCVDVEDAPDLAPVLAVLAAYAKGETKLVHVRRLRLKESDRLRAVEEMLAAAGVSSYEKDDVLVIVGGEPKTGVFDGKNDHRMVMSEVILAGTLSGGAVVTDGEAVKKSYPSFYEDYKRIGGVYVDLER